MNSWLYRRLLLEAEFERIWGWTCEIEGSLGREARPTAAREMKIEPEQALMEESALGARSAWSPL